MYPQTSALPSLGSDLSKIPMGPPPPGIQSNFINPPSAVRAATAIVSVIVILECFFLTVRFNNSIRTIRKIAIDDWFAVSASLLSIGLAACILYLRPIGRHMWDISIASMTPDKYKVMYAADLLIGPSIFCGKCSLLLLYYRVFSPNKAFRYKIYGTTAFCFVSQMAFVPVTSILCTPPRGSPWGVPNPNCTKAFNFGLVPGISDILIDLYAIYLPVPMVLRLQMPLRRRIGLIAIFMTGLIALIASITATFFRVMIFKAIDPSWAGYMIILCGIIETGISVICSSMPAMASFSRLHIMPVENFSSSCIRFISIFRNPFNKTLQAKDGEEAIITLYPSDPSNSERLRNNQMSQNTHPEGKPRIEIQNRGFQGGLEKSTIQKTVSIEQSWEIRSVDE